VAKARVHEASWKQHLEVAQAAFAAEHATAIANYKASKAATEEAEATAKALVLAHFAATGEKKPVPGVEVKERVTNLITDPAAALAWAQEKRMALIPESLDEKALLKIASVAPLPFVTKVTEPQAQLATTLVLED
jgi:hypothetical protein